MIFGKQMVHVVCIACSVSARFGVPVWTACSLALQTGMTGPCPLVGHHTSTRLDISSEWELVVSLEPTT